MVSERLGWRGTPGKLALVLLLSLAYLAVLACVLHYGVLGYTQAGQLAYIPILAAGWFFGPWSGVAAALAFSLTAFGLLSSWHGVDSQMLYLVCSRAFIGGLIGGAFGWLGRLYRTARGHEEDLARERTRLEAEVAERKGTEAALRVKDFAIAASINAMALTDLQGVVTYVNEAFLRMWGYGGPAEVLGRHCTTFWKDPQESGKILAALSAAPCSGELAAVRRDGSVFWAALSASLVKDEGGKPLCFVATFMDITARRAGEEALRESEEHFQKAIEDTDAGYFRLDSQGRFQSVNRAWLKLHGYAAAGEVVGRDFSLTHVDSRVAEAQSVIRRLLDGAPVALGECTRRCKDGALGYHTFSAHPLVQGGKVVGLEGFIIDTTSLKRAQTNYERLFAAMTEGFALHEIICDAAGKPVDYRFLAVNPAFERHTGLKARDIVGRTVLEVLPGLEPRWIQTYGRVALTGEPAAFHEYSSQLGRHYEVSAYQHGPGQFATIISDVTEQRRAAEMQNRTLSLLRATLESTADGILVVDGAGRMTDLNERFAQMWRMPESILASRDDRQALAFVLDQLREPELFLAKVQELYAHPEADSFDVLEFKDGRTFERYSHAQRMDGRPVGRVWSFRDVTVRRRAEEARRLTQFAVDRSADAALRIAPDARILYANEAACRALGYTRDELLALTVHDIDPNFPREVWAAHWEELKRAGTMAFTSRHKAKNGRVFPVEITINFLSFEGQEYNWAFVRDISERKQIEERLRRAAHMESLGRLAGGIAHDFNNQLTGILGHASTLVEALRDDELRGCAESIVRAARRAAGVTKELLTLSRKDGSAAAATSVHAAIGEAVLLLKHSLDKRITIRNDLQAQPDTVLGDAAQLQNALLSLALNAQDAMPSGGELAFSTRSVALSAEECRAQCPELAAGRYVRITVADTGTGMDQEALAHVFEPFFTTKAPGKGTGIGLAAVYSVVGNHRGAIHVHSELGRGTAFTIHLPVAEPGPPGAAPAETPRPAVRAAPPGPTPHTPVRILVVDDVATVRELLSIMLRSAGHTVTTCADGAAAVEFYRQFWAQTDLVILDVVMPRMGGRDAFLALRQINPKVKVLVSSGYSIDGDVRMLLDAGALGFLQKPFEKAEVLEKVQQTLRG